MTTGKHQMYANDNIFEWATIKTGRGHEYRYRKRRMPEIPINLLECTFYLYEDKFAADNAIQTGGTGFFVGVQSERFPERSDVYAITCKHVVKPKSKSGYSSNPVIRLNTKDGKFDTLPLTQDDWYSFEDIYPDEKHDIAIHELGDIPSSHKVHFLLRPSLMNLIKREEWYYVAPGDDVFMVGRYIDDDGRQKNRPSVRFGNISMMPDKDEPIPHWEKYDEESYTVEMRSLSGYSGSPVFRYELGFMWPIKTTNPAVRIQMFITHCLGIQWSQPDRAELKKEVTGREIEIWSGMSNVIPSWHIDCMLDWEVFKMHRQENDEEYAKKQNKRKPPVPTSAKLKESENEFTEQDFEDALSKVSKRDKPDEKKKRKKG